jgi:hypothetical protein
LLSESLAICSALSNRSSKNRFRALRALTFVSLN